MKSMNPYEPPNTDVHIEVQNSLSAIDASAWWFFGGVVATRTFQHLAMSWGGFLANTKELPLIVAQAFFLATFLTLFYNLATSLVTIGVFRLKRPWWLLVISAFVMTTTWTLSLTIGYRMLIHPLGASIGSLILSVAVALFAEVQIGRRNESMSLGFRQEPK